MSKSSSGPRGTRARRLQGLSPHQTNDRRRTPRSRPHRRRGAEKGTARKKGRGDWNHAEDTVPHQRVTAKRPGRARDSGAPRRDEPGALTCTPGSAGAPGSNPWGDPAREAHHLATFYVRLLPQGPFRAHGRAKTSAGSPARPSLAFHRDASSGLPQDSYSRTTRSAASGRRGLSGGGIAPVRAINPL